MIPAMTTLPPPDALVILGPTAAGKTSLGVRLANALHGEIISADSRQVYRGLDIGSGKDLGEYMVDGETIPHHLIDIVDVDHEFSVFEFQQRCFEAIENITSRGKLPIIVGGTGLYLEAVLKGYKMVEVPENTDLRNTLRIQTDDELEARLLSLRPNQHNQTDLQNRNRLYRAIEIAEYTQIHPPEPLPDLHPLILGTRWSRSDLHARIAHRLKERMNHGLIEEVTALREQGVSDARLYNLGLEYRYVTDLLTGEINNKNDLFQKLLPAIKNLAKRQETWFRRMERNGMEIHWIDEANVEEALAVAQKALNR